MNGLSRRCPPRARLGHSPCGNRCSTISISRPKATTSKLPLAPSSRGSRSCNCSLSRVISAEPSKAPQRWPEPPTTAMKRYSIPIFRLKGVGLTKRCMWAYSQPATEASNAASTKTRILCLAVSMPIDSAITRLLLSARMARPSRESSRLASAHRASISTSQASTPSARGEASDRPMMVRGGSPPMPVWPPRNSRLPKRKYRLSPQAIVQSGR